MGTLYFCFRDYGKRSLSQREAQATTTISENVASSASTVLQTQDENVESCRMVETELAWKLKLTGGSAPRMSLE